MPSFLSPNGWFSIDYPDAWMFEIDDTCTSFFRVADGVGAFQLSAFETASRESAHKNLEEYIKSAGIEAAIRTSASSNGLESASSAFIQDDSVNNVWMFTSDRHVLFATYIREASANSDEDADVEHMLRTLRFLD